jgi:hypothetical protein
MWTQRERVGWVERTDTHRVRCSISSRAMGIVVTRLNPSYEACENLTAKVGMPAKEKKRLTAKAAADAKGQQ